MKKTQILIADDHAVMRMGLTALFDTVPEFKIIGEASTGLEAVDKAHTLKPDIIIMDLMMPIMDGVAATRKIGSSSECENAISCPLFMTGCKEMKTGCKHANDRPFGPLGGPGAVFTCSHPCTSPVWRVSRDRAV